MWGLRVVADANDRTIRVREVYYDERGRPYAFSETSAWTKLRFLRDWLGKAALAYPGDFDGEPEWLDDLRDAEQTGDWSRFKTLEEWEAEDKNPKPL